MKQFLTILFIGATVFAQTKSTTPATATKKTTTTAAPKVPAPARNLLDPSTFKLKAPEVFKVKFSTSQGDFVVQVTRAWAPLGADRFYNLIRGDRTGSYYNGAAFYRVIAGFMAQFGMAADPKVTQAWNTQYIKDDPVKKSNTRGMISYAKPGMPDARTTQLFINYADNSRLDAMGFAPFGEVIEGMDVVDKFYSGYGDTDQDQLIKGGKTYWTKAHPKLDYIKTATIVPAAPAAPVAPKTAPATSKTPDVKK